MLTVALDHYARVEVTTGGGNIRLLAEDRDQRITLTSPDQLRYDGTLDLHKAALNMLPVSGGVEVATSLDVPDGAGLGASSALAVGLVAALAHAREQPVDTEGAAALAVELEVTELGREDGWDAWTVALGGCLRLVVGVVGPEPSRLHVSGTTLSTLADNLTLAWVSTSHRHRDLRLRVAEAFTSGNPDVSAALEEMRAAAVEAEAGLVAGDLERLGRAMNVEWAAYRRIDPTLAVGAAARAADAARRAGALGVKGTGSGAGGCVLALAPADDDGHVRAALRSTGAELLDVSFAEHGLVLEAEETDR